MVLSPLVRLLSETLTNCCTPLFPSSPSFLLSQFVEPTGKRFLLAIDVSGSMTYYNVMGSNSVSACVASAAMAMVTARTEANYHMVGFSSKLVPLKIHSKMTLSEVIQTIAKVTTNGQRISVAFASLVPRPLPDFISQLWRKIGRRPGIKTMSQTGNGGLG